MNPYKQLGDYEPFNLFGVHAMVFESFKKVACAGIDGRTKSESTDVKEAIYSLNRAIEQRESVEEDFSKTINFEFINHDDVINHYRVCFGDSGRLDAAKHILLFCKTNNVGHLKDAVTILEHL